MTGRIEGRKTYNSSKLHWIVHLRGDGIYTNQLFFLIMILSKIPGFFVCRPQRIVRLFLVFMLLIPAIQVQACHLSHVQLDSVVNLNPGYDVFATLCIGGGVSGQVTGANSHTGEFGFGFYSSCTDTLDISYFTPSLVGDSTGTTSQGHNVGPVPGSPFGAEGFVLYSPVSPRPYLMCVNNPAKCGSPHQQCFQIRFRFDHFLPDSLRVFGIEGNGNAAGGCTYDPDMYISFKDYDPDEQCYLDVQPGLKREKSETEIGVWWQFPDAGPGMRGNQNDCQPYICRADAFSCYLLDESNS